MSSQILDSQRGSEDATVAALVGLVLVAGLAFGLLVNTALVLNDSTGDEDSMAALTVSSTELVINDPAHDAVAVSDRQNDSAPVAYELRLAVEQPPNAATLDLADLDLELDREGSTVPFDHVSTSSDDSTLQPDGSVEGVAVARDVFFIEPIAVDTVDTLMTDQGDRYELVIPVGVFVAADGSLTASPDGDRQVTTPERGYDDADLAVDVPAILEDGEGIDNTASGVLEAGDFVTVSLAVNGQTVETVSMQVPDRIHSEAGKEIAI